MALELIARPPARQKCVSPRNQIIGALILLALIWLVIQVGWFSTAAEFRKSAAETIIHNFNISLLALDTH